MLKPACYATSCRQLEFEVFYAARLLNATEIIDVADNNDNCTHPCCDSKSNTKSECDEFPKLRNVNGKSYTSILRGDFITQITDSLMFINARAVVWVRFVCRFLAD